MNTHTKLITEADITDQLGVSARTARTLRHDDPSFPQPLPITARTVRYRQADAKRWIAGLPQLWLTSNVGRRPAVRMFHAEALPARFQA